MKNTDSPDNERRRRPGAWKRKLLWVAVSVVGFFAVLFVGAWLWLTPQRVTSYFNSFLSSYFKADVHASEVRFDLFSDFPHISLEIDSLTVVSATLDSISPEVRRMLPSDCDSLVSAEHLRGSFNVAKVVSGKWEFGDVDASGINVNLVSVSDSVNNFDILPAHPKTKLQIPYISVDKIRVHGVRSLSYFDLETATDARLRIGDLSVTRRDKDSADSYDVSVDGDMNAVVKDFTIFENTPFSIDGDVDLAFDPFNVKFHDFRMMLDDYNSSFQFNVEAGKNLNITDFSCDIESLELQAVWRYVAMRYFPELESLADHVVLDSNVTLSRPYNASEGGVPQLDLTINSLKIKGEDLDLDISARINNIFNAPRINTTMRGLMDLSLLKKYIPGMNGVSLNGKARADISLAGSLPYFSLDEVSDVDLKARLDVADCTLGLAKADSKFHLKKVKLNVETSGGRITGTAFDEGEMAIAALVGDADIRTPDMHLKSKGVRVNVVPEGKRGVTAYASAQKVPMHILVGMDHASMRQQSGGVLTVDNFTAESHLAGVTVDNPQFLSLAAGRLGYAEGDIDVDAERMNIGISMSKHLRPLTFVAVLPQSDLEQSRAAHTDEWLDLKVSQSLRDFLANYDVQADVNIGGGTIAYGGYGAPTEISGVGLLLSPDSICLRNLALKSQTSGMRMKGRADDLRPWLSGVTGAPLKLNLDVDIDKLDFNQIAHTYRHGDGSGRSAHGENKTPSSAITSDSIIEHKAVLVPRNLDIDVRLKANEAKYTNLDLTNLSGHVGVHDGIANLDSLKMDATFGHGEMSFCYDTSDIEQMKLSGKMDLSDIDVVKFFDKYDNLLAMMPQMKNLSGTLGMNVDGSFLIFPQMYMNVPSLEARIGAEGKGLTVKQSRFIRNVTRMMLIPYDSPLHIHTIRARANVHDNLLELYPFDVEFFKYKVRMMGINDFQGHLNYKISVLSMPVIPLHFGIHVGGTYSDPVLRLGGPGYNVTDTRENMKVVQNHQIDLEAAVAYFMNMFVNHASDSYVSR